jgi:hypothetical protein
MTINTLPVTKELIKYFMIKRRVIPLIYEDKRPLLSLYERYYNNFMEETGIKLTEIFDKEDSVRKYDYILKDINNDHILSMVEDIYKDNYDTLAKAIGSDKLEDKYVAQFINYIEGILEKISGEECASIKFGKDPYKFANELNKSFLIVPYTEKLLEAELDYVVNLPRPYDMLEKELLQSVIKNKFMICKGCIETNVDINTVFLVSEMVKNKVDLKINPSDNDIGYNTVYIEKGALSAKGIRQLIGYLSTNTNFDIPANLINSKVFNNKNRRLILELLLQIVNDNSKLVDIYQNQKQWKIIFRYMHINKMLSDLNEDEFKLKKIVTDLRNNNLKPFVENINNKINRSIDNRDLNELVSIVKDTTKIKYTIANRVLRTFNTKDFYRYMIPVTEGVTEDFNNGSGKTILRTLNELNNTIYRLNPIGSMYSFISKRVYKNTVAHKILDVDDERVYNNDIYKSVLEVFKSQIGEAIYKNIIALDNFDISDEDNRNKNLNLVKKNNTTSVVIPFNNRVVLSNSTFNNFSKIKLEDEFSIGVSWKGEDLDLHSLTIDGNEHCYFGSLHHRSDTEVLIHSGDVRYCPNGGQEKIRFKVLGKSNKKYMIYLNAYDWDDSTAYKDKEIIIYNKNDEVLFKYAFNLYHETNCIGIVDLEKMEFTRVEQPTNVDRMMTKDGLEELSNIYNLSQIPFLTIFDIVKLAYQYIFENVIGNNYNEDNETITIEIDEEKYINYFNSL